MTNTYQHDAGRNGGINMKNKDFKKLIRIIGVTPRLLQPKG